MHPSQYQYITFHAVLDHIGLVDMWVYDFQADSHRSTTHSSVRHSLEAEQCRLRYAEVLQEQVLRDLGSVG